MAQRYADVERAMKDIEAFAARVVSLISIEITSNLIASTPVDTGWARANWLPSFGSPTGHTVGSRQSVSTVQREAGRSTLSSYNLSRGRVFIVNNVPYIEDLNNGSSQQAPAAFVQSAVAQGVRTGAAAAKALGSRVR